VNSSADTVRSLIVAECAADLAAFGLDPDALPAGFDLRAAGVIDSLGFLELVTKIEERLGVELDFEAIAPEELTVVDALARHIAAELGEGASLAA
jgi:acyl carrier protein